MSGAVLVGVTADRRWEEQARLFAERGVDVLHGPTLRTIDLSGDDGLRRSTTALVEAPPDYLIVTTGMGMKRWLEAAARWGLERPLLGALAGARVVARGAKATSAARGAGLEVWWRAPHETMQEIVDHLSVQGAAGARVALQLFDLEAPSTEAMRAVTADLVEVPVYEWALPHDLGPAGRLIDAALGGALRAVTFTSQPAVHHLFRVADRSGRADALRAAFAGGVTAACVGPVCAAAAKEEGIDGPIWPEPPRLPAMVRQVATALTAPGPKVD